MAANKEKYVEIETGSSVSSSKTVGGSSSSLSKGAQTIDVLTQRKSSSRGSKIQDTGHEIKKVQMEKELARAKQEGSGGPIEWAAGQFNKINASRYGISPTQYYERMSKGEGTKTQEEVRQAKLEEARIKKAEAEAGEARASAQKRYLEVQAARQKMAQEYEMRQNQEQTRQIAGEVHAVKFGAKNFGSEPLYIRGTTSSSIRDKYVVRSAPEVSRHLEQNRMSYSNLHDRVMSPVRSQANTLMMQQTRLPNVMSEGHRMQMTPEERYRNFIQLKPSYTMLSGGQPQMYVMAAPRVSPAGINVYKGSRSNILERLSPKNIRNRKMI